MLDVWLGSNIASDEGNQNYTLDSTFNKITHLSIYLSLSYSLHKNEVFQLLADLFTFTNEIFIEESQVFCSDCCH